MLAAIVTMQVEVLKLGASIGRSIERSTALQNRNELLRVNVASLGDDRRIERLASGMGMMMPGPATVGFLSAKGQSPQQAAASIHAPDPASFLSGLSSLLAASDAVANSGTTSGPATPADSTASGAGTTVSAGTGSAATSAVTAAVPIQTSSSTSASSTSASSSTSAPSSSGAAPSGG